MRVKYIRPSAKNNSKLQRTNGLAGPACVIEHANNKKYIVHHTDVNEIKVFCLGILANIILTSVSYFSWLKLMQLIVVSSTLKF